MITKRYKVAEYVDVDRIFRMYEHFGYTISNPDCKTGRSFDVIDRGNQKIAGFDLLMDKTPPNRQILF